MRLSLDKVESALKAHPDAKILAFVHAETSTGAQRMKALGKLAKQYGVLTIVDTVITGWDTSKVDEWQLDAVYSGSQKCLSACLGYLRLRSHRL